MSDPGLNSILAQDARSSRYSVLGALVRRELLVATHLSTNISALTDFVKVLSPSA